VAKGATHVSHGRTGMYAPGLSEAGNAQLNGHTGLARSTDYYPAFGLALRAAVDKVSGVQRAQTPALVGTLCLTPRVARGRPLGVRAATRRSAQRSGFTAFQKTNDASPFTAVRNTSNDSSQRDFLYVL